MLIKYFLILTMMFINSSWAVCFLSCNTAKCAHLEYYLKNCKKCTKIGSNCSRSFCQNHPVLCFEGKPMSGLSIGDARVVTFYKGEKEYNKLVDVCLANLFPTQTFKGNDNAGLSINNLNMLNISFFEQTGGDAHKRNIGSMESVIVNYLRYINPEFTHLSDIHLDRALKQWVKDTFHMSLEKANNFHFHMMVEYIRRDLYKRKGIPTQIVNERYKGFKYPVTISKIGCPTESAFPKS